MTDRGRIVLTAAVAFLVMAAPVAGYVSGNSHLWVRRTIIPPGPSPYNATTAPLPSTDLCLALYPTTWAQEHTPLKDIHSCCVKDGCR